MLTSETRANLSRLFNVESRDARLRGDMAEALRLGAISQCANAPPVVQWPKPPTPPAPAPRPQPPCCPTNPRPR